MDLPPPVPLRPAAAARVVGVLGGSGGAGATTVAAALALRAAASAPTCLVDADPWGAGVDRVLGCERVPGIRWTELAQTSGRFGSRAMCEVLPRLGLLSFVGWDDGGRWSAAPETVGNVIEAAAEGHAHVVVDLSRTVVSEGFAAAHELLSPLDALVLVARGTVAGLASAARTLAALDAREPGGHGRIVAVVRGEAVDESRVERALGVPVLAGYASDRRLDEQLDLGLGPVRSHRSPVARLAAAVWAHLESTARADPVRERGMLAWRAA